MTLAEIRPLLVAAVVGLATLSAIRSYYQRSALLPIRIPVRFKSEESPRRVEVRKPVN